MSDQSPSTKSRDSRLAISGWPLRRKVALALAVPLLLAATLGGLRVTNDLDQSANASASAEQVTILEPAIGYLTAAETGMVAAQSSISSSQAELGDALIAIRAAAVELEKTRDSADLTFEQRRQVDVILDLSRALRDEGADPVSPGTWIAQLRQMHSGVTALITTIKRVQLIPEIPPRLELLSQTVGGRFALAQQQALAANESTGRRINEALFAEFGAERVALDRLAGQDGVSDSSIQTLRTNNGERVRGTINDGRIDADADAEYDNLQATLLDAVDKDLARAADDAQNGALLNALLTLVALATAIAIALLISRSLVNPIRRVREGALKVTNQDLPDAVNRIRAGAEPGPINRIDVTTHEEIGQLARAVDDLHQQAVTLASGEARLRSQVGEMFVTLSRRNTTLVNQQLNLIEALERDEEDPKRLESLFRLDHLAARMRRTADSLLILADAPTRSADWESVSIADILQAATAGVTDYQRVRPESALATKVDGSAAGDLVHLLTELVDNSLSYSSPNTNVVLAWTSSDDGVTITVADAGLGIPIDELKVHNENLRAGVKVTPDTARRMGLFVVSRLAQRHGIQVSLKANRGDGVTAYVFVPNALLPERAHPETVPVEEVFEPVVVEEPAALEPIAFVPLAVVPTEVEPETEPVDVPVSGSDVATIDESDPLGIGNAHLQLPAASRGLPIRERGATLRNLTAAAPVVSAVPDIPEEPETQEPEATEEPVETFEPAKVEAAAANISALMAKIRPQRGRLPILDYEEVDPAEIFGGNARDRGAASNGTSTAQPFTSEPAPVRVPLVPLAPEQLVPVGTVAVNAATSRTAETRRDEESSINGAMRSSWLSSDEQDHTWSSTEVEAGWERTETVAEMHSEATSDAGLPVRQPGACLVPGSVSKPVEGGGRDPEAIRARLSAHKAGVRRGRTSPLSADDHQQEGRSPYV